MIDGATSDEDKVTPVYKLEEISELLRSSHVSIVKEVAGFVLKRLDHRSPIVKQKALRLIKYVVGKSGAEFRREMQRNSVAIRQLSHYKGQPDSLKGDSLNKAVRDTANETVAIIFALDDNKAAAPSEDLNRRIQGFGNTNFETAYEEPKSFLSEVVGIGSATLKQGLSSFSQSPSMKKNDTGSYRSPNLQRSLTTEYENAYRYERSDYHSEEQSSSRLSNNSGSGSWGNNHTEETNGNSSSSYVENKTREERLLETIVTSGGVRLQPTREALQVFLTEATKLDALALCHALEAKLASPLWQVRMKAVCVLEAILRRKDVEQFFIMESYFIENREVVVKCTESPQASLREKSMKVFNLLVGEHNGSKMSHLEKSVKAEKVTIQVPDLIDTSGPEVHNLMEDFVKPQSAQPIVSQNSYARPIIDDLFSDGLGSGPSVPEHNNDDDPFADVSFHTNENKEPNSDIFSAPRVDQPQPNSVPLAVSGNGPELFDIFGSDSEALQQSKYHRQDVTDVMAGLSVKEGSSTISQNGSLSVDFPENIFSGSTVNPSQQAHNNVLNGMLGSQGAGLTGNAMFPLGPMAYNMPPDFMYNPAFASQPLNYEAMNNLLAQQQQLFATMTNFQHIGNVPPQSSGNMGGKSSPPLPDIFNPTLPNQTPMSLMNSSKKEDTKAFDFISDHLAAAKRA